MQLNLSSFVYTYDLTDEEYQLGATLSEEQKVVLHNRRAAVIEAKTQLLFDPNDVQKFVQDEAYLKGQLDLLTSILSEGYH